MILYLPVLVTKEIICFGTVDKPCNKIYRVPIMAKIVTCPPVWKNGADHRSESQRL